jgi:ferritin-like protein
MAEPGLHEDEGTLSSETLDMHRAISSLMEELEAIDWYAQRIDATDDENLREILTHNRDEEKEHACMVLEWIRRRDSGFDGYLRRFLFTDGSIREQDVHRDAGGARVRSGGALPLRRSDPDDRRSDENEGLEERRIA